MSWQLIDWSGGGLMALCGLCGILTFAVAREPLRRAFWLVAGAGFLFLTADELWSLHERIGRWLYARGIEPPPGINHTDDLVLLSYGVAGLALCFACHREIRVPGILVPFLLGFAALALAIAIDAGAPVEGIWPHIEEPVETAGAAFFLVGFMRRLRWSLAHAGYLREEQAAPLPNTSTP